MLVSFKALAVVVMCDTGRQCLEPIPNKRIPKELGHEPWCVPKTQWACTACASGVKGVVGEPGPPKRIGGFRRPHQAEHVPKSTRRVHLPVDVTTKMEDGFAQRRRSQSKSARSDFLRVRTRLLTRSADSGSTRDEFGPSCVRRFCSRIMRWPVRSDREIGFSRE